MNTINPRSIYVTNCWWNNLPKILVAALLCFFFLWPGVLLANGDDNQSYPDIFVQHEFHVTTEQTVGRLIVANGDVTVSGKVMRGIIIVNGNLFVEPTAYIDGKIVVLGGQAAIAAGAAITNKVLTVSPANLPDAQTVAWLALVLGVTLLLLLPLGMWRLTNVLQGTFIYSRIKYMFLKIERRWPALYLLFALFVSSMMLALFSELAWKTLFRHSLDFLDNIVIFLIRYYANSRLDKVMIWLTDVGSAYIYGVLAVMVLAILALRKRWNEFGALLLSLAGAGFLNFLLKNLFERARPDMFRVISESGYSFPSGHAMVSLCFYGMLAIIISRYISSLAGRLLLLIFTFVLVILIGISRIYLGVHYPTDVLAGYTAGATWLGFCISLLMWWERKTFRNR